MHNKVKVFIRRPSQYNVECSNIDYVTHTHTQPTNLTHSQYETSYTIACIIRVGLNTSGKSI